jgi:hypothetical protein
LNHAARYAGGRLRAPIAAAIGVCVLMVLAAAVLPGSATSGQRPVRVLVMGQTGDTPPASQREATGRVTGFQSFADGTVQPYKAPYAGKVISWSITLAKVSRPTPKNPNAPNDVDFFNELFGSPAQARIGILKEVPDSHPKRFRLVRQSPIQTLNPYFGEKVHFALDHPLTVLRNHMVALTIPTWAPALFAPDIPVSGNAWRASRLPGKCGETPAQARVELPDGHPQQRPKSEKVYGCYYEGSRLIYTATVVKKPQR